MQILADYWLFEQSQAMTIQAKYDLAFQVRLWYAKMLPSLNLFSLLPGYD